MTFKELRESSFLNFASYFVLNVCQAFALIYLARSRTQIFSGSNMHNYIHKIIIKALRMVKLMMSEITNKTWISNQQSIAEQLTTFDIRMKGQLAKNLTQKYVHSSFERMASQQESISRKVSAKSSWFECVSQVNQVLEDNAFPQVSSFVGKENVLKKTMKIYSLMNVKKTQELSKNAEKRQKINVSFSKKALKNLLKDIQSRQEVNQKKAKQFRFLLKQAQTKDFVKLPLDRQNQAKNFKEIKQPYSFCRHPQKVRQRYLNGADLSKIIAERALLPQSKPYSN